MKFGQQIEVEFFDDGKDEDTYAFSTDLKLSQDQKDATYQVVKMLKSGHERVTLGGYAGTGKSTVIPFIIDDLGSIGSTAFCCFTGKAASVLRKKLRDVGVEEAAGYIGTIHGLIYHPSKDIKGNLTWHRRKDLRLENTTITRIVVDEVSMVGEKILCDLLSYGVQILAVGDPAQLPPVGDVSVIGKPDIVLSKIHRQAENNPIIQLASHVRTHGDLPKHIVESEHIRCVSYEEADPILEDLLANSPLDMAILTRTNKARTFFNKICFGDEPKVGNTVICLKNDNREGIVNGMRGLVHAVGTFAPKETPWFSLQVDFPDDARRSFFHTANALQFGREKTLTPKEMGPLAGTDTVGTLVDFGAALTVHKAQGSGFSNVFISPDKWGWNRNEKKDWAQWLYTAITRSSDKLYFLPTW